MAHQTFFFKKLSPSVLLIFFVGCGVGFALYPSFTPSSVLSSTEKAHIRACFSPEGQCTKRIVSAIESAKTSILVHSYSFTSQPIAQALVHAFEKGVDVKVLIDKSQLRGKHSQLSFISQRGIPVFIDPAAGIAHSKVMIIDERLILTGSFNWSKAADSKNAENLLFLEDPALAQVYKKNWDYRVSTSRKVRASSQVNSMK